MKTIKVVAAIIKNNDEILIAKRLDGDLAGLWEFPGGKVEANETNQEALKREIEEEMELEIDVKEHVITIDYDYPTFHLNMSCYLCEVLNGTMHLNNHSAIKWINYHNDVEWVPADIEVIKGIRSYFDGK